MNSVKTISQPLGNPDYRAHPSQLNRPARRAHVTAALLHYNRGIIEENPEGANAKFEKLTLSPFIFLRGSADLMYRDLVGTDADQTNVLLMGDVHLENFGVMEAADGSLLWGLNDFDEAHFGPFSWDVKRGATSTLLAATERGFKGKDRRRLVRAFATAYLKTLERLGRKGGHSESLFTKEQGPKLIRKLIRKASKVEPKKWLGRYIDQNERFLTTDEIAPLSERQEEFQAEIEAYLDSLERQGKPLPEKLTVLDVATKKGSGTGSIGLWRFYALTEVTRGGRTEKKILEIKHERPSVVSPYAGDGPFLFASEGSRVAFAQETHLHDANPFYGYLSIDGESYLVRERSPFKARIKLEKLKKLNKFMEYTEACGGALAHAHLRSIERLRECLPSAERPILHGHNPHTFAQEMEHFASQMASQVTEDWKGYIAAHQAGTFTF